MFILIQQSSRSFVLVFLTTPVQSSYLNLFHNIISKVNEKVKEE